MGLNLANGVTGEIDGYVGDGLTAIWIGVLGLSLMATGLVLLKCKRFSKAFNVKEFGLIRTIISKISPIFAK